MPSSAKIIKGQLAFFKPLTQRCSIETARLGQARLGGLMAGAHKSKVCYSNQVFRTFVGSWIVPKLQTLDGVVLYLHGGGFVSGDIDYARGFGTIIAARSGVSVFCAAYRLAPEHPYPAALEDALAAYRYLLDSGYEGRRILLFGESAGGGLIFSLALKLKEAGLPPPGGLIAISPWCDLTLSGDSYTENRENDPTIGEEILRFYASLYAKELSDPYVSPLFGDLSALPPSLLFAGGDEILRDDAVRLHQRLLERGCRSSLTVAPGMWHVYILYGLKESKRDYGKIDAFIRELLGAS